MDHKIWLYRLTTGELIVSREVEKNDTQITLLEPHSITEQPGEGGNPPRVMLQPSIPQDSENVVILNASLIILSTEAPANIVQGYRQALSSIIMPNAGVQKPANVTPIDGLRSA